VLDERGSEYFESYHPNPFMLLVQPVRRAQIPAVTHVDGTARLQSVTETENPLYHRLISRFAAHTGVPVVLNTSVNLRASRSCTARPKRSPTSSQATWTPCSSAPSWSRSPRRRSRQVALLAHDVWIINEHKARSAWFGASCAGIE
jgi:hypothetical protein